MTAASRPDTAKSVGERLRILRLAYGKAQGYARPFRQSEMARLCGIGIQAWHNAETGYNRIGLENAMRVRARLGVSLDFIYFDNRSGLPHVLAVAIEKIERPKKV